MSVRFTVRGIPVECDEPEEAAAMIKALGECNGAAPALEPPPKKAKSGRTADYPALMEDLNPQGKKVIRSLMDTPKGLNTDQLVEAVGIKVAELKYVIRGIRGAAQKNDIKADDVISSDRISIGKLTKSQYKTKITASDLAERV